MNHRAAHTTGGLLLLVGVFLMLVTLMDVFGSLSGDGLTSGYVHLWPVVVGLPLVVVGGWLLQHGSGTARYPSPLVCPSCGRRSRRDARFCAACGAKLE